MDWYLAEGNMSLVCFSTGDASFYTSTGGGLFGASRYATVKLNAKDLVLQAQDYLKLAIPTESITIPGNNIMQFSFLTPSGIFSTVESFNHFENNSSVWTPLFEQANEVIGALRL